MNEFSMVCRILGSLFQRAPEDQVVKPLFDMIANGSLKTAWPLEQDELWECMQPLADISALDQDYQALFNPADPAVPFRAAEYDVQPESAIREFLVERGMPMTSEAPMDTFGGLLLSASWLEDQAAEDEVDAQIQFFECFILPWSSTFLGKVEAHAKTSFYRNLAIMTREALAELYQDLSEDLTNAE